MVNLRNRILRNFRRMLATGGRNVVQVTLSWVTGMEYDDPNLETSLSGVPEQNQVVLPAMAHFISPSEVVSRGYTELRAGDAILDFDPDDENVKFSEKPNLQFTFLGQTYVQRNAGKDIQRGMTTVVEGEPLLATVYLMPLSVPQVDA